VRQSGDQDWDKLIVAMDACNYEGVVYMGPLDDFVVNDSNKYQYVNILVKVVGRVA
jgi:hypothetical protein